MVKAITIIERARTYFLLSNDKKSKPFLVGNRVKLEFALQDVDADMVIATTGNNQRCIVLIDYNTEDTWNLIQRGEMKIHKIKSKN